MSAQHVTDDMADDMRRNIGLDVLAKFRLTSTEPTSPEEVPLPAITA